MKEAQIDPLESRHTLLSCEEFHHFSPRSLSRERRGRSIGGWIIKRERRRSETLLYLPPLRSNSAPSHSAAAAYAAKPPPPPPQKSLRSPLVALLLLPSSASSSVWWNMPLSFSALFVPCPLLATQCVSSQAELESFILAKFVDESCAVLSLVFVLEMVNPARGAS